MFGVKRFILLLFYLFMMEHLVFPENIYRWYDKDGTPHYTDNPGNIPEEYRKNAEKIQNNSKNILPLPENKIEKDKEVNKCELLLDKVVTYAEPHSNLDEYVNSENLFIEAMECYPESNEVKLKTGEYFLNNRKFDSALIIFNELYKKGYRKIIVMYRLADCYQGKGEYRKAKEILTELLKSSDLTKDASSGIKKRIEYLDKVVENVELQKKEEEEKEKFVKERFEKIQAVPVRHFVFLYDKKTSEIRHYSNFESKIEDTLEEAYSKIGNDFNFYPDRTLIIYLSTWESFTKLYPKADAKKIWGIYDPQKRNIVINSDSVVPENYREVLFHEFTHFIVDALSNFTGLYPSWLNEGLAEYEERASISQNNELPYPERIALRNYINWGIFKPTQAFSNKEIRNPYLQSYAAAYFLIQKIGFRGIKNLLIDIGKGCKFEDCFQNYYRGTLEKFEKDLIEFINTL